MTALVDAEIIWVLVLEDEHNQPTVAYGPFETLNQALDLRRSLATGDDRHAVAVPLFPPKLLIDD